MSVSRSYSRFNISCTYLSEICQNNSPTATAIAPRTWARDKATDSDTFTAVDTDTTAVDTDTTTPGGAAVDTGNYA